LQEQQPWEDSKYLTVNNNLLAPSRRGQASSYVHSLHLVGNLADLSAAFPWVKPEIKNEVKSQERSANGLQYRYVDYILQRLIRTSNSKEYKSEFSQLLVEKLSNSCLPVRPAVATGQLKSQNSCLTSPFKTNFIIYKLGGYPLCR